MNKGRFGIRRQLHSTKPPGQHNHTSRLMAGGASKSSRSLLKASTNVVIVSFTSQSKLANGVDNLTQLNLPSVDDLNLSNITEQVVYLQYDQLKYGQPILVGKFIQQHGKAEKVAYHIYLSGNHLFLVILNHSQVINKAGKQIQTLFAQAYATARELLAKYPNKLSSQQLVNYLQCVLGVVMPKRIFLKTQKLLKAIVTS